MLDKPPAFQWLLLLRIFITAAAPHTQRLRQHVSATGAALRCAAGRCALGASRGGGSRRHPRCRPCCSSIAVALTRTWRPGPGPARELADDALQPAVSGCLDNKAAEHSAAAAKPPTGPDPTPRPRLRVSQPPPPPHDVRRLPSSGNGPKRTIQSKFMELLAFNNIANSLVISDNFNKGRLCKITSW